MSGHAAIEPYNPESRRDRYTLQCMLTRLIIGELTRTQPFRPELVDGAYALARQLEDAALSTRAS